MQHLTAPSVRMAYLTDKVQGRQDTPSMIIKMSNASPKLEPETNKDIMGGPRQWDLGLEVWK